MVQTTSQVPLVHTAVPPTGVGQTVHDAPHEVGEFERHCEPQVLKPNAQVKPQVPEAQVAVELAGGAQGVHALPQLLTEQPDYYAHPPSFAPALAESFTIAPDRLSIRFTLREAVWSDGTPIVRVEVLASARPPA